MRGSKSVVYKYVSQGSQIFGERLSVLGLLCAVTGILKKNHVAVLHRLYRCLRVRSHYLGISGEFHFLSQKLRQSLRHGRQRKLRLRLSLRLAQMGAEDHLSAVRDQLFDGRKGCHQTVLVCDLSILQRYVKVAPYQDALAFYVDVIYRFLV